MGRLVRHHARGLAGALVILMAASVAPLDAQIGSGGHRPARAALERQTTDPDQKREGGTQPRDWDYELAGGRAHAPGHVLRGRRHAALRQAVSAEGVHARAARCPAVVVGHGINALSIGIEKYAARFAERGLVAMAIDYQSYGFSGSGSDDLRLLEPDPSDR